MRLQAVTRVSNAAFPTIYEHTRDPLCCICNKPVPLGISKTEDGSAIHEECYLLKLNLHRATSDDIS